MKHELPLVKKLLQKELQPPTSLVQLLPFIYPYKAAFDCLTSFSRMKIVKIFLRNSKTSERQSNIALLSTESKRAESIDLDSFVDEFDSRHDNRRIKLH